MRLRVAAIALAVLVVPWSVGAQPTAKIHRIGFLGSGTDAFYASLLDVSRAALRELGHVEGNTAFESRFGADRDDRLRDLAADLVRSKVDVIMAHGSPAVGAAKRATTAIPIVMIGAGDPVGTGFVNSLARPGGNITGVSTIDADLAAKRLQLLKEVVPKLSRVAVLRNPVNPVSALQLTEVQTAARSLGVETHIFEVRDVAALEAAFASMPRVRADALYVTADPLFLSQQSRLASLTTTARLPTIFARNENVEAGGLLSYGPTLVEQFRHAATYVDKILKGAKPGNLPVERASRVYLVVNLNTAKALGLTIPAHVLQRADQIID